MTRIAAISGPERDADQTAGRVGMRQQGIGSLDGLRTAEKAASSSTIVQASAQ